MSTAESISAAITQLQEATNALLELKNYIESHNVNIEAHQDIREAVNRILDGESIYSNTQIRELINENLNEHKNQNFNVAHPGWDEVNEALTERLATIESNIQEIKDYLNGQKEAQTDLDAALAAVEARYAPVLDRLISAMKAAQLAGDTELADSYIVTIDAELARKSAELKQVMEDWQREHSSDPTL